MKAQIENKITKEQSEKFKEQLPHGSIAKIAASTKLHRHTVEKVLSGEAELNDVNMVVVYAANKIITDLNFRLQKVHQSIEKTLNA